MENKILVYPQKAFYHKLNPILDRLGLVQTNDIKDDYNYAIYFNHNHDKEDYPKEMEEALNGSILSTDKLTVDRVFTSVFGYSSFVDSGVCIDSATD